VLDPYVLLVHQGMIEDVFLEDLKTRGVEVTRSSPFLKFNPRKSNNTIDSACGDTPTNQSKIFRSRFVVGCDGAHSQVRKGLSSATMDGESGKAAWGVLDGMWAVQTFYHQHDSLTLTKVSLILISQTCGVKPLFNPQRREASSAFRVNVT
jgi:2-polyprenyl-6-methoxyphenol hydroxylase-like FAD-dependent oxidoreductase